MSESKKVAEQPKPKAMPKCYWLGEPPTVCEMPGCNSEITERFYDARSKSGQWGLFCSQCFATQGMRLGIGRGQQYERQRDGRFLCVAGRTASG